MIPLAFVGGAVVGRVDCKVVSGTTGLKEGILKRWGFDFPRG